MSISCLGPTPIRQFDTLKFNRWWKREIRGRGPVPLSAWKKAQLLKCKSCDPVDLRAAVLPAVIAVSLSIDYMSFKS